MSQHVAPYVSKVNELDKEQRKRATSVAKSIEETVVASDECSRAKTLIARFHREDKVRDPIARENRRSTPSNITTRPSPRETPSSPSTLRALPRQRQPSLREVVATATLPPLTPCHSSDHSALSSPAGNAFAGDGYWAPVIRSVDATPTPTPTRPSFTAPKEPASSSAYQECLDAVEMWAGKVPRMSGRPKSTDRLPLDEAIAAEAVLQERIWELDETGPDTMSKPSDIQALLDVLAVQQRGMAEQFSIRNGAELQDAENWGSISDNFSSVETILDQQKTGLHMLRERRKSKEIQLSGEAYALVWATHLLQEKQAILADWEEKSKKESSEDEGYSYDNFLRSIQVEVRAAKAADERVSRHQAPTLDDLSSWAQELKRIKEVTAEEDEEKDEEDLIELYVDKVDDEELIGIAL